jgi:hypothetical protein
MHARLSRRDAIIAPRCDSYEVNLEEASDLRPFVRDGRLVAIPKRRAKRLALLDLVAQGFEPGRHYTEKAVNECLRVYYDDVAALRRYLVDEGFLDRDGLEYWCAGGTIS